MSMIVSLAFDGGIMMSGDNNRSMFIGGGKEKYIIESHFRKLYITPSNVGISFGGDAETKKCFPLEKIIEIFLRNIDAEINTPMKTAQSLLDFLRSHDKESYFYAHVCGYEVKNNIATPQIIKVISNKNLLELANKNPDVPFVTWAAASQCPEKLVTPYGKEYRFWVSAERAYEFTNFLFKTSSDITNQEEGARLIGEKPDILIIRPFNHTWVNLNELKTEAEKNVA